MATIHPEKRLRKKKKSPQKFRLSYSLLLLFGMIVVGSIAGIVAYQFGKQALEGVNSAPAGIKVPKISPTATPKDVPKPSPKNPADNKTSLFLDEAQIIAETKARSQEELGSLKRPSFVAKANPSDRKAMYVKVDQAYNSMRDPLAISASADERIAERISSLRQRVYASNRSNEGGFDSRLESKFDRSLANNVSGSMPSTSVELIPIRSRWQDRDAALLNSKKVNSETSPNIEVVAQPTNSLFISEPQTPRAIDINRR